MIHLRYFVVVLLSFKAVESSKTKLVVEGRKANITKFPHSVFLRAKCYVNDDIAGYWICGGSVLNQKIILTAAHCIYGCYPHSTFDVNMGHVHRDKGFSSMVKNFILHQAFRPLSGANDIGLVLINDIIKFNLNIKRISIMKRPPYFERARIAGWGLINVSFFSLTYTNEFKIYIVLGRKMYI